MKKQRIKFSFSILFLVLCLVFCSCSKKSDISLIINNKSGSSIFDVEIRYCEKGLIKEIQSGETIELKLNPSGEAHLEMKYKNSRKEQKNIVHGYFEERGYNGKISINIEEKAEIKILDEVSITQ